MTKEVEKVRVVNPDNWDDDRSMIVVEADDNTTYVFEFRRVWIDTFNTEDTVKFSHRYYPNREKGKKRVFNNYRLPQEVKRRVESLYGEIEMMDGMVEPAEESKQYSQQHNSR